jgi:PPIC-type PPIASE domain
MAVLLAAVGFAQNSPATSSPATPDKAASPAPDKKSASGERVVLRVGNQEVTESEFESRIGEIEGKGDPDREGALEKERRRLGDDYASVLMLSHRAVETHLDATPEIKKKLEIGRIQILSDAEFASLMDQAKPTLDEVTSYYKTHTSDYEQVQVRRLFLWKKGADSNNTRGMSPETARARADAILKTSAEGGDATKLTEEFKKSDEGLLDMQPLTFPRGELPPAMEKAAFASQEGKWSQVQDTKDSIILVQLLKREQRQLGEVESLIEQRLQNQKLQVKLKELKKNAGIWMDEKYFGAADGDKKSTSSSATPMKSDDSTGSGGTNEQKR